jgi:hypothetical protein
MYVHTCKEIFIKYNVSTCLPKQDAIQLLIFTPDINLFFSNHYKESLNHYHILILSTIYIMSWFISQCYSLLIILLSTSYILHWNIIIIFLSYSVQEKFEDTKRVIRIRISKKNWQHNGQHVVCYWLMAFDQVLVTTDVI